METRYYQHIERLNSDDVDGILNGKVYLFTKLDGTNIGIHLEDGKVVVNSRKREISIESDNAGSCQYVLDTPKFKAYLDKHPNHYLYGEFLVKHTIRTYKETAWRKVYIFDVVEYSGERPRYLTYDEYSPLLEEFGIEYIPCIAVLNNPTEQTVLNYVDKSNFLQANEADAGEGIVIKRYDFTNKYGRTSWAKIVRAEFSANKKSSVVKMNDIEASIVEQYVTISFIEKEISKVLEAVGGEWDNKYIGRCLGIVWHEFVNENMWDIVKKYKNPTVHFSLLYTLVTNKTKVVMKEFLSERGIKLPF